MHAPISRSLPAIIAAGWAISVGCGGGSHSHAPAPRAWTGYGTPDDDLVAMHPGAVREWCVNTAAVSPATRSIVCDSEDGTCYRWNLVTNTLDQAVLLAPPTGEAYTPTVIGPDGTVYAINNAVLNAVGR